MDLQLQNKNALVCGSTQGIGKATAISVEEMPEIDGANFDGYSIRESPISRHAQSSLLKSLNKL